MTVKLYIELEENEKADSFSCAKAFYELCLGSLINAETVAKMMLLKAQELKGE